MNIVKVWRSGLGVFGAIAMLVLASSQTLAASPASQSALTVSPAITEQVTPIGQPKKVTIQVTNTTGFPLPISARAKNFIPLEQIEDSADTSKYDASKWFVVTDPDFILQPKETKKVAITITPPKGAEPGGHYATIYFTPLIPETALTPSTAYLSAQVGTLAFLIVPGNLTEKLSVASFSAPHISQSRNIDFSAALKNSGDIHLAPNAAVHITNWRGKTVTSVPLKSGIVLPGTEKDITATWHSPAFIGKYTATLTTSYGASNTAVKPISVSFWVLPWRLLLGIIIPLTVAVWIYFKTRGRWQAAWQALRGK